MISDNASTYLAAAEDIKELFESDDLREALGHQQVTWSFIPKRAPWYGGFWEQLVGLTKQAVKKTLGQTFVTLQTLETVVVEIEGMLNDRPLTLVMCRQIFLTLSLPHQPTSSMAEELYLFHILLKTSWRMLIHLTLVIKTRGRQQVDTLNSPNSFGYGGERNI